eukprot:NODE_11_length_54881_cov_1.430718.p36 type:complete len:138 gc:universal NODE_11_length_54881_cov_1.430718:18685-19098(+)
MSFFSNLLDKLRSGNFTYLGNMSAWLGALFGLIGSIINILPFGILGLVLVFMTAMIEFPVCKYLCPVSEKCTAFAEFFKKNAWRAIWFILSGVIFFCLTGVFFSLAGVFDILAGLFYGITQLKGYSTSSTTGASGIV